MYAQNASQHVWRPDSAQTKPSSRNERAYFEGEGGEERKGREMTGREGRGWISREKGERKGREGSGGEGRERRVCLGSKTFLVTV